MNKILTIVGDTLKMKNTFSLIAILVIIVLGFANASGQNITVASTGGSGSPSSSYPTLAAAISAINGGTIHNGAITLNVTTAAYTETAPVGGFVINASTGTALTPIILNGNAA